MKKFRYIILGLLLHGLIIAQPALGQTTYCNPLNLDYTYATRFDSISYRSGADPAVVEFRGEYYMFVTRSLGYWHSSDLSNWSFITPEKWYFEGSNAPAAHNYKDSVLYVTGNPSGSMAVLYTDNPKKGDWKAVPSVFNELQDPDLFIDDDGQAYMFWGSSNKFPIRGKKLDRTNRFLPSKEVHELFNLHGDKHGWERFGENHTDTVLSGYIEGPWLTKHNNKYYLQYAAPGTEFNVYGDGVYISNYPLGPYHYAPNNPIVYKPGGYANGAGHGSTIKGPAGQYWDFGTMAVAANAGWERRIGMFPTYFDVDGLMYSDTYFGDYPHYTPATPVKRGQFTGWMLLSYKKPVKASSQKGRNEAKHVVDEKMKTFWLAADNNNQQWIEIDLLTPSTVYALQINFHDYQSNMFGKVPNLYHRYIIEGSVDGNSWDILVNKHQSFKDTPNDYVQLEVPVKIRYMRYKNIHVPTPNLAISGMRIFGLGEGRKPKLVKDFSVERSDDPRDAMITWKGSQDAQGYNVLWGIAPEKLYSSWMVYDDNKLDLKSLTAGQTYYFAVEAFNENGISERTAVQEVK